MTKQSWESNTLDSRRSKLKYRVATTALNVSGMVQIRGTNQPAEPTIYFTREAWVKQRHLVDKCPKEVGWFAMVDHDPTDNSFTITELVIPEQTVTAAETDIGKEALADAAIALIDQGKDTAKMYAWFHSHVNMGVSPSGQDEYQVEEFLEDLADQPEIPAFIRGIVNKKGELKLDVYYVQHGIAYQNVKYGILYDDDPQWTRDIDEIIKENVKEYSYSPAPYNSTYLRGGGYQQPAGKSLPARAGANGRNGNGGRGNYAGSDDYAYGGHGGYGGYVPGLRTGYPYFDDAYDYDSLQGNTALALTPPASDVPEPPKKQKITQQQYMEMDVVYNGANQIEVLMDEKKGTLHVCDAKGYIYDYDDYVGVYGEIEGLAGFAGA